MAEATVYVPDPREPTTYDVLEGGDLGSGGSGGGDGVQEVYEDRAPAAPDDPSRPAVNYESATGALTHWSVANQSWG